MNTITRETLIESGRLATLYAAELRGQGITPGKSAAVTSDKILRCEFQNGALNKIAIPFGRVAKWAQTFPEGSEFDVTFSAGRIALRCGNSFVAFSDRTAANDPGQSPEVVPAILFDDGNHTRPDFRLVTPANMSSIADSIAAAKHSAKVAKLRRKEIQAKSDLKNAVKAHCAHLAAMAGGLPDAIAHARLQVKALRLLRRALARPLDPIVWIEGEAHADGAQQLCPEHFDRCAAVLQARADLAAYKPQMRTPRWGGTPQAHYGPKFDKLTAAVKTAEDNLNRWIRERFNAECAKNGLPEFLYFGRPSHREFSRARLAVRDWKGRKWELAQNYMLAIEARRQAQTNK